MLREQKRIRLQRIVMGLVLLIVILIPVIVYNSSDLHFDEILFCCIFLIVLAFFIGTLLLSCKVYEYNGRQIIVYAGWYYHYVKIDGEKLDEHNTIIAYTPIVLSCMLDDGTPLQATISLTNRIALKINNRLWHTK